MPGIKYFTRIIKGMRFETMNRMMDVVKDKWGQGKVRTFLSMIWCAARHGAGYHDYVMFGFADLTEKQRKTFVTRVRNKKICEQMNDYTYGEEFDDKFRFNQRFAKFLHRKTLNGESCTIEEFKDFIRDQDTFFAKPNHGSRGQGVKRITIKDYQSPEEILQFVRDRNITVLEHTLKQHPDMAKPHPFSVNTLRIATERVGDTVYVPYIAVRFGRGGSCCDNTGQGGMSCCVDRETKTVRHLAMDDSFNTFASHPETGVVFDGYPIPMLDEAIAMAKEAAMVIPEMRHIGWDIAITPTGPAIIEGNEYPSMDMCQLFSHTPNKTGLWPFYEKLIANQSK